jgi:hypothetical protein
MAYPYKPDSVKCPSELQPGEKMVDHIERGVVDVIARCAICKSYAGYSLPADDYEPIQPSVCINCSRHIDMHFDGHPQ